MTAEDMLKLAKRIAKHTAPCAKKVDQKLLTRTAKRLRITKDVVTDLPCSKIVN